MAESTLQLLANRYLIQAKLQSGGMTTIYRARDLQSDSLVAIKLFDRDRHLPVIEREAFFREVSALQNLSHKHIVRLLDTGEDEKGRFFLSLELMKHDLLQEREAKGPAFAGWDVFADLVVMPLLDGLAHAHATGVAHRDVKPANVLIAPDGTIKLADFGVSKLKRTLQPRITLNEFMSPPFCPPEADTGASYARDVYSVGVLCLWAMSSKRVAEYADFPAALDDFDAPPEVSEIIAKTISPDPAKRQSSAAILAAELSRIQAQRRRHWLEADRPRCALGITTSAMDAAKDELGTDSEAEVRRFIAEDINTDSAVQRIMERQGTMDERFRAGHYAVLGSTFRYHVAQSDRGYDSFALINLSKPEPHYLQRDRENAPSSPLTFQIDSRLGIIGNKEAIHKLERVLEAFEAARKEEQRRNRETALFDTWQRVLNAKMQHERDLCKPVAFDDSHVDGTFLTLKTKGETEGLELGQGRVIYSDDGRFIRGEVWEVRVGELVLNCPGAPLFDVPKVGEAKLDQYALQVAVERQREAVDRIRTGTCTRSTLKALLLEPSKAEPPSGKADLSGPVKKMLDESKCDAVIAALSCPDILLVQGPPGTGKTEFIVGLIVEELRRNPRARILLTSQTHIAIDNALERLADYNSDLPMVRIAREQSTTTASTSAPYLLSQQMRAWRNEVVKRSSAGLEAWAARHGFKPAEVRTGALMRQLATIRERMNMTRGRIAEEEQRKAGLGRLGHETLEMELERERVLADLQELSDQLDSDSKRLNEIKKSLRENTDDADTLLAMTVNEQNEWADMYLCGGNEHGTAERLIRLQSEWVDRFNAVRKFVKPLIERSSVVAGTCVGLASIAEANDVEFDLCIIDESSKATAMECCVPMARSRRWVLVGDSKQLPPFQEEVLAKPQLRKDYDLESGEASESLFERLRRLLPEANKVMLRTQYRMVEPIGRLISDCFYPDTPLESHRKEIDGALCKLTNRAVNWMSTRKLVHRAEQATPGRSVVNPLEASHICDLLLDLDELLRETPEAKSYSVLVLSGYDAQVRHIERRVAQIRHQFKHLHVECCTIDRVQGRQANAVFFSVTRSNAERNPGFLRALERINVALSRAKDLLLIVGDDDFVERARNAEALQRVLAHIRRWQAECYMGVFEAADDHAKGGHDAH